MTTTGMTERQAYALAHPINSAAGLAAPELTTVVEMPSGNLLLTILAVDR